MTSTANVNQPVEAILLDCGGVFTLPQHEPIQEALDAVGLEAPSERIDRAHYEGFRAMDLDSDNGENWGTYLDAYAKALRVPARQRERVTDALSQAMDTPGTWTRTIPESVSALHEISRLDLPLGIVSNSNGTVEQVLRDEAVCQVGPGAGVEVDTVIDSHVVGFAKPDPTIFEIALEEIGAHPSRCIFVGDSVRNDVEGARLAGIQPILFDPYWLWRSATVPRVRWLEEIIPMIEERGRTLQKTAKGVARWL